MISVKCLTDVFFSFFYISGHETETRIRSLVRVNLSLLTRMICLYGRLEMEKNRSMSCIRNIIPHSANVADITSINLPKMSSIIILK